LDLLGAEKSPKKFVVIVPKAGKMADLCEALSKLNSVDSGNLLVTDVFCNRFHKIYMPNADLSSILDRDDIVV
jgi:hypothetical protein